MTISTESEGGLDAVLADIRACRACLGQLPHTPRPVVSGLVVISAVMGVSDHVSTAASAATTICASAPHGVS